MKMRERSQMTQQQNQELKYKKQYLQIKLQEKEEKLRQISYQNQALQKASTEQRELTIVQQFQIEKLQLHLNRVIPDYKRKRNARHGILITQNKNSDSRTSTARALYSNKFINRDTITKVQGVDLEFIDQNEIERYKLKLKQQKLEQQRKIQYQDAEVQTDEILKEQISQQTDNIAVQDEVKDIELQQDNLIAQKKSDVVQQQQQISKAPSSTSLLTKNLNQSSTVRLLLLQKSVQMTKNSSQHSFAQKSVNVGVQSYEVQIQTDSVVEQVDKLSIVQLQKLLQQKQQQLKQSMRQDQDNMNNHLSQIEQRGSQEQGTVGHSIIETANQSQIQNYRVPSPPSESKITKPIDSPISKRRNPSALSMHGLTTPSPNQTPSVANQKNQQQFRVDITPNSLPMKMNNKQRRYYDYEGSQDSEGHGQMSAKLQNSGRKSFQYSERKAKRRQTIAADLNISQHSWNLMQQRRETSDGVLLHNVRSSKNLITPMSNNSRSNLGQDQKTDRQQQQQQQLQANQDNGSGMNLSAYQRALAYISAEKPKQKEFFELQKKQMQQRNYFVPEVYNRLFNDASIQQERKKAYSKFIQRQRAKQLTQVCSYKTPRNNFPTASDQDQEILDDKIRGFFPIHSMQCGSRQNSQYPIDSSYLLSNNGSLLNLSAQPSLNKFQQMIKQPDNAFSASKKRRNLS